MTAHEARHRVADFWDEVLAEWRPGTSHLVRPLDRWHAGYSGKGAGAVDLDHYPDPYIGDLRGLRSEPRLVFLGLNPGIGYDDLQGNDGVWTRRIRESGYSRCFERSPAEDPVTWRSMHGKESTYWRNIVRFERRWLGDEAAGVSDLLNLELYPWHSNRIVGAMSPPLDLIKEYVWDPVEETAVDEVFAFGRVWLDVCRSLGLDEVGTWGPDTEPVPGSNMNHWRVSLFRLDSGQFVVASSQQGSAAPPGPGRTVLLKQLVDEIRQR
ncbi:anti-phage DNA glycosylase Brig1 [Nocardioides zhouii]|uniref:Uncharacterized protein n=1 Tax=Nocardioides zhouii TaxID=1168729 RepID=A0A4Q2SWH9_9ACTN|nr:hypothetical protein [Nocardioides zhouii]RYC10496.1 hypothetical protein EUA94_13300 [Nocardioides zhouii]